MIIVIGTVVCKSGHVEKALILSQTHVERSLGESGCLHHSVLTDPDNPERLVFVEYWQDMPALRTHFAVAESGAFVKALGEHLAEPPDMKIFEANEVPAR